MSQNQSVPLRAQPAPVESSLVNTKNAAAILGRGKSTLDHWHTVGTGPRCYMVGGRRMYSTSDLQEWLESRSVTSSADAIERGLSKPPTGRNAKRSL